VEKLPPNSKLKKKYSNNLKNKSGEFGKKILKFQGPKRCFCFFLMDNFN
jgi:hypothetical protein